MPWWWLGKVRQHGHEARRDPGTPVSAPGNRSVVKELVDAYGADRLIYGGGFETGRRRTSLPGMRERTRLLVAPPVAADQAKVLGGTAARLFGSREGSQDRQLATEAGTIREGGASTMTRLTVDAGTLGPACNNLDGVAEICDESGRTLGYFHPRAATAQIAPRSPTNRSSSSRKKRTGKPLGEILNGL